MRKKNNFFYSIALKRFFFFLRNFYSKQPWHKTDKHLICILITKLRNSYSSNFKLLRLIIFKAIRNLCNLFVKRIKKLWPFSKCVCVILSNLVWLIKNTLLSKHLLLVSFRRKYLRYPHSVTTNSHTFIHVNIADLYWYVNFLIF